MEALTTIFVLYIIYRLYNSFNRSRTERKNAEMQIIEQSRLNESEMDTRKYFFRATANHRLNNFRLAIEDYNKAFDLNPDNKPYTFHNSSKTFNNYVILMNRSSAKTSIWDFRGAKLDKELAKMYKEV